MIPQQSILEVTLEMANAQRYITNFRDNGIDLESLPFLTDEDLESIGLSDENQRKHLLEHFKLLPQEKKLDEEETELTLDDQYILSRMENINNHLRLLHANLSYALYRQDVKRTGTKYEKEARELLKVAENFHNSLLILRDSTFLKKPNKIEKWKYVLAIIVTASVSIYAFKNYFRN